MALGEDEGLGVAVGQLGVQPPDLRGRWAGPVSSQRRGSGLPIPIAAGPWPLSPARHRERHVGTPGPPATHALLQEAAQVSWREQGLSSGPKPVVPGANWIVPCPLQRPSTQGSSQGCGGRMPLPRPASARDGSVESTAAGHGQRLMPRSQAWWAPHPGAPSMPRPQAPDPRGFPGLAGRPVRFRPDSCQGSQASLKLPLAQGLHPLTMGSLQGDGLSPLTSRLPPMCRRPARGARSKLQPRGPHPRASRGTAQESALRSLCSGSLVHTGDRSPQSPDPVNLTFPSHTCSPTPPFPGALPRLRPAQASCSHHPCPPLSLASTGLSALCLAETSGVPSPPWGTVAGGLVEDAMDSRRRRRNLFLLGSGWGGGIQEWDARDIPESAAPQTARGGVGTHAQAAAPSPGTRAGLGI